MYRKTEDHQKPYQPQGKKTEDKHCGVQSSDMQTLTANCKQFDNKRNQLQYYSSPSGTLSHQLILIYSLYLNF